MSHPDVGRILIREEDHLSQMKETVEPFLEARRETRTLYREKNHPIHCVRYTPEHPEAVLVLSHGFTESVEKYRELIYYFLQADYVVYAMDHCEHGKSYRLTEDLGKVHCDTYERWCEDLLFTARFTRKAYPDLPLCLFGHSMGGGIAAAACAMQPELFDKVILNAPMIRPATMWLPWWLSRLICAVGCAFGKEESYAPGNHAYDSSTEQFETSASTSRARYDYYMEKRRSDPLYQMSGATYGWVRCAIRMNQYLQSEGWQKITSPVLLLQADTDTFVVNAQQDLFIKKLSTRCDARLVHIDGSRHEIFNSQDDVLVPYLNEIFSFLSS